MTEHDQQSALLGKIVTYTELLVNDPRSTIFVSLAETYRKMGLFNDAREIAVKGLEQHPDFGPAYVVLARIECQLENFDASCAGFERALALDPNSLAALVGYARVKLLLQHDNEARDLLLHARSLSPADPVINKMLLGLSSPPEVDVEVPAQVFQSSLPPANNLTALASTTLADLYLAQGLTEKALALYRQLLSRNPDNLKLRRKIRELEGRAEEPPVPATEEVDASPAIAPDNQIDEKEQETPELLVEDTLEQLESSSLSTEHDAATNADVAASSLAFNTQAEVADEVVDEVVDEAPHQDMPMAESALADQTEIINKLNNWLNNIRLRREHV